MAEITPPEVVSMVRHWLETPVNGYLGSGYGNDLKSLLQLPLAPGVADDQITKLRGDVPVLQALPRASVNLFAERVPPDRLRLQFDIAGTLIIAGPMGEA